MWINVARTAAAAAVDPIVVEPTRELPWRNRPITTTTAATAQLNDFRAAH